MSHSYEIFRAEISDQINSVWLNTDSQFRSNLLQNLSATTFQNFEKFKLICAETLLSTYNLENNVTTPMLLDDIEVTTTGANRYEYANRNNVERFGLALSLSILTADGVVHDTSVRVLYSPKIKSNGNPELRLEIVEGKGDRRNTTFLNLFSNFGMTVVGRELLGLFAKGDGHEL